MGAVDRDCVSLRQQEADLMHRIKWTLARDVLIVVICMGILLWGTFSILGMFVHAIVLLLLAMAVAFLVTPLVNVLDQYLPRGGAALLGYIFVLAALCG